MPGFVKGNWSKAAIGGLVLLNLVLIVLLVLRDPPGSITAVPPASGGSTSATPVRSSPGPTASTRTPTGSPSTRKISSAAPPPTPTATPSPTKATPVSDRSRRVLAVSSAKIAWRAVFGACPTDPDLEVSRDGGRTWQPSKPKLRSVSRLRAYSESSVFAVGGAEGCAPRYLATGGPGEPWSANGALLDGVVVPRPEGDQSGSRAGRPAVEPVRKASPRLRRPRRSWGGGTLCRRHGADYPGQWPVLARSQGQVSRTGARGR